MDIWQILCTLCEVKSQIYVFLSDLLPLPLPVLKPCTLIVNNDPHRQGVSNWLAIRLTTRSSRAYYIDSYGIVTLVSFIHVSYVCGQYCCLLAL